MGLRAFGGRTLAWNKPVIALHKRFGFEEIPARRYTAEIDGAEQLVVWTEKIRNGSADPVPAPPG